MTLICLRKINYSSFIMGNMKLAKYLVMNTPLNGEF